MRKVKDLPPGYLRRRKREMGWWSFEVWIYFYCYAMSVYVNCNLLEVLDHVRQIFFTPLTDKFKRRVMNIYF